MSRLEGAVALAPDVVARYKYISRMGRIMGYYAGHILANKMGAAQVPLKVYKAIYEMRLENVFA